MNECDRGRGPCAGELYNKGFISYPRTETDKFPDDFDYQGTITNLHDHPTFGFHARALSNDNRFRLPGNGGHDDNAHPPIYPTKLATGKGEGAGGGVAVRELCT